MYIVIMGNMARYARLTIIQNLILEQNAKMSRIVLKTVFNDLSLIIMLTFILT